MADQNEEVVVLLQKVSDVHKVNAEVIARLKIADRKFRAFYLVPHIDRSDYVSLEVMSQKLPQHSAIQEWVPAVHPPFVQLDTMNVFNDNVDYTVNNFADVVRLNEAIAASAKKFGILKASAATPVLAALLTNIEIVQQHLADLEACAVVNHRIVDGVEQLQKEAEVLHQALRTWKHKVISFTKHHSPNGGNMTFDPKTVHGDLTLSPKGRIILKDTVGRSAVSSTNALWTSVSLKLTWAHNYNSGGWVFFGVCSDPKATTRRSASTEAYGWNTTTSGWNCHKYQQGRVTQFPAQLFVGEDVTLDISGPRLTITGPRWKDSMTLPDAGPWYIHINAFSGAARFVKDGH